MRLYKKQKIITMKLYKQLITILCLTAALSGCIKEDLDDCYEVYLAFECINPNYKFSETVQELELLFYNEAGELAYHLPYTRSVLSANGWKANITYDVTQPGKYTVVALVNYHTENPLSLTNKENKEKFLAEIKYDNERWVNYTVTDSYHGIYELQLNKNEGETMVHTIPLSKNTNTIQLTIEFEQEEDAKDLNFYRSYLVGENARVNWNYTIPAHQPVYYKHEKTSYGNGEVTIQDYFKTMRIHTDGNLKLHMEFVEKGITYSQVVDIPRTLVRVEKDGVLIYDTNEKLELYDYFEIKVKINGEFVITQLTVSDWNVVIGNEDV
ncbi:MAG: FimB/Mfa2 family fimbrial subunit [Clostridium sp.]|nr:FimB/Mfa2 family fimbrial subunit [Clostridium sp.]